MNEKINLIVKTIKEEKRKIIKTMIKLMIVLGVIGVIIAGIFYGYVKSNINYSRSEAEKIVLTSINGQIVGYRIDLEDGILEYEFKIKDGNNRLYEVKVNSKYGAITDIDYNG